MKVEKPRNQTISTRDFAPDTIYTKKMEQGEKMRDDYNFSTGHKNPYTKRQKKAITINIDVDTIDYFKGLAETSGLPYQTLMNMYLSDCAANHREIQMTWK